MSRRRKNILILTVFGIVLVIIVAVIGALNIEQAPIYTLVLYAGLVVVTMLYAYSSMETAGASVKMAEEMKVTRYASLRPIINIAWVGCNKKAIGEISASFKSIGPGPALNLKCYLAHEKYKFEFKHDRYTVLEKGEGPKIDFPSENFDFEEWAEFAINCDYQSVYGEGFRSVLKFKSEDDRYLEISELGRGTNND